MRVLVYDTVIAFILQRQFPTEQQILKYMD